MEQGDILLVAGLCLCDGRVNPQVHVTVKSAIVMPDKQPPRRREQVGEYDGIGCECLRRLVVLDTLHDLVLRFWSFSQLIIDR